MEILPLIRLFYFPTHLNKIYKIDRNSKYRRAGRCKADHGKARARPDAHEIGHGQTHDKGLGKSLQHYEQCL